ncbi:MAG: hypothetical protein AB7G93_16495 [Bdellovibrionales bacterium]
MTRNELFETLQAGFRRFYSEGYSKWSKDKVVAAISPAEKARDINEPEVQSVLKELEKRGLIRLYFEDDCYLEVLHD